jgi:hypothetical protein
MKSITPYKGITLEFEEEKHKFTIAGRSILSVTAITGMIDKSGALIGWAVKLFREFLLDKISNGENITPETVVEGSRQHSIKKQQAADIGTEIHEWVNEFIDKKNPKMPDKEAVKNGALAFLKWIDENKVKFLKSEEIVYSKKYDYAGILDAEAIVNKERCIVDFKSSNGIYNEMRYQVAGYQCAKEEMTGKKYDCRWIIQFGKDTGEFTAYRLDEYKKDLSAFLGALVIKKREAELKKSS